MAPPYTQTGTAMEYLHGVLSQRGPQAVPYEEAAKGNIREQVSELQKVGRSLVSCAVCYDTLLLRVFNCAPLLAGVPHPGREAC